MVAYREHMLQQAKQEVPIHGALRLEQFLAGGNGLALVDFDAASVGDPLFDVAEFLTSLQYLQFSQGLSSEKIQRAFGLFKTSYQENVPWRLDRDHLAWYAVAFLLGKLHDTIKNLEVQALAHLPEILQLMNTWLEQLEPRPATAVR
ncbi:MAG: hypothetical protein D6814_09265 [Calditrichaeota bacterium]|nr:MAG: hypothetical protein D6814_09265 [Calditrichota bacterium]